MLTTHNGHNTRKEQNTHKKHSGRNGHNKHYMHNMRNMHNKLNLDAAKAQLHDGMSSAFMAECAQYTEYA